MNENIRARHWNIKTYKTTSELYELLKGTECIYRMVSHDKDINEETGEYKKAHTHLVLSFKNPRLGSGIIKFLELESNAYLAQCRSVRQSIRYLLHVDDVEKANYTIDEIIHNDTNIESYFTEEESDTEKVFNIYEDAKSFYLRRISLKQFLMLHPEFIYRMHNFKALVTLISQEYEELNKTNDIVEDDNDIPF